MIILQFFAAGVCLGFGIGVGMATYLTLQKALDQLLSKKGMHK